MPYGGGFSQRRSIPTTRKTVTTHFVNPDQSPGIQVSYEEQSGPSPVADIETQKSYSKQCLACGCFYPDSPVAGICTLCQRDGQTNVNICRRHFFLCFECGVPMCFKHSRPVDDNARDRLCMDCHSAKEARERFLAVLRAIGRTFRFLFFKE